MPLTAGRSLGPYEIVELLGAGGMGEVYKARDPRLGRDVAIKVLRADRVADPERKRRFMQEARAASALNHPNIITIYDISQADGVDFLVMEYVRGSSLAELIQRRTLRLKDTLRYATQIAAALAKAHSAGIVHRDMKPGNVMVNDEGLVKVLDFGLAKLIEPAAIAGSDEATASLVARASPRTEDGAILGTIAYMSPEQAEGKGVDARSDIFSFGVVLYEMITGERAFRGSSTAATLAAVLREEPKPASQIVPAVPKELERVVQRCLRKDADRRFHNMSDVKVELEDVQTDSDSSVIVTPAEARPQRKSSRWPLWAGAAAVVAVGCAWHLRPKTEAAVTLVPVPLTSDPGSEMYPSFSPDGSQVAYTWTGEDDSNLDIYVRLASGGGKPLRLTSDPRADSRPSWSPDGHAIAFLRSGSRDGSVTDAIYRMPPLGGAERKVVDGFFGSGTLSWTPDGKYIAAASREEASRGSSSVYVYSVESGAKRRLTTPPAGARDQDPVLSPDGRTLLFNRCAGAFYCDPMLAGLTSDFTPADEPRKLLKENGVPAGAAWTEDGKAIVFALSKSAGFNAALFRVRAAPGSEPVRVAFAGERTSDPAISLRGNRLAYGVSVDDVDIWKVEPGGTPRSLISSTRSESNPQYSPDGKRIAFGSDRSGKGEIWVCGEDGSNFAQLTRLGRRYAGTPRWSPDGRWIAFDSQGEDQWEIFVMDAEGGQTRQVTEGPGSKYIPSWSRDGKRIYYTLDVGTNSGSYEIWRLPAAGGEAKQITKQGGHVALESSDGKWLYYTKNSRTSDLYRMPVDGGEESKVLDRVISRGFQVFEDGIYYLTHPGTPRSAPASVQFFRFSSGKSEEIAQVDYRLALGFAVSPDRKKFLYAPYVRSGTDLMLVENFR